MEPTKNVQQACESAIQGRLDPDLFKALGDANRLAIVVRLATAAHPLTVTEVSGCCGAHLSGVSRHLAQLKRARVVSSFRSGREVRYRLNHDFLSEQFTGLVAAVSACKQYCCPPETYSVGIVDEQEIEWT
jgi:DNA-binding transcriptional ArsR family regulator